ncbi:hypothetical protein RhiirB3_493389 [Rhizophagus irregularis]|nr:hypothetical protein RhiirB3_493389 [Rhizophagus irregularis]
MTDKRKFCSSSLNKRSNSCPNFIIKMWIYPEGAPRAIKLKADVSLVEDLDDLAGVLTQEINVLRNLDPQQFVFLDNENRRLASGTDITLIRTTDKVPLIVRYQLSDRRISVDFRYSRKSGSCKIPHSSGSFSLLKEEVMKQFNDLQEYDIYFLHEMSSTNIRDTFNFNYLIINDAQLKGNEYQLRLKVMIEGKKSFSEWELNEVLAKVLGNKYLAVNQMPVLDLQRLPVVTLSNKHLKDFSKELQRVFRTYRKETNTNEQVCREYIFLFLRFAVHYAILNINNAIYITNEWVLKGTRGNGPVDYIIFADAMIVLICEAKADNMEKGLAQLLVQLHSAVENFATTGPNPKMYGIVTTGTSWRFVCWTGSLEDPTIYLSQQFSCNFQGDLRTETNILSFIARILRDQCEPVHD